MSADVVHIDVFVLRGWARTWGGLAEQLTTEQHALVTELETLQLEFMSSGVSALDRAAGELSRSGTYSTRVANAAEVADGDFESVDYAKFDKLAFGPYYDDEGQPRRRGGALDDFTDGAATRFINRPEHDPVPGSPAPQPAPHGSGSGGGSAPSVSPPSPPSPPSPSASPTPTQEGPDRTDALMPDLPLLVHGVTADRTAASPPELPLLIPGGVACPDGSIPFGDDGIVGGVLPTADFGPRAFDDGGVLAGVLPAADLGPRAFDDGGVLAGVLPTADLGPRTFDDAGIVGGVLPAADLGPRAFDDGGVLAGVLPMSGAAPRDFGEDGIAGAVLPAADRTSAPVSCGGERPERER